MNHLTCINYTAFSIKIHLENHFELPFELKLFFKMNCYSRKGYLQILTADWLAGFEELEGQNVDPWKHFNGIRHQRTRWGPSKCKKYGLKRLRSLI